MNERGDLTAVKRLAAKQSAAALAAWQQLWQHLGDEVVRARAAAGPGSRRGVELSAVGLAAWRVSPIIAVVNSQWTPPPSQSLPPARYGRRWWSLWRGDPAGPSGSFGWWQDGRVVRVSWPAAPPLPAARARTEGFGDLAAVFGAADVEPVLVDVAAPVGVVIAVGFGDGRRAA